MSKQDETLALLAEISGHPREEIDREKDLVADLGLDSPKTLRFLVDLEEKLDVEISDEDAAKMSTVGDILDYLVATG